jgi:SAM-dependent methyltransferase
MNISTGADRIFEAMRQSDMRDWVGPGDPAAVAAENFMSIIDNLPLRPNDTVLDFGCEIGRTSVALANYLGESGCFVGTDIIPSQIRFCREQFAKNFPHAKFYCLMASNPYYNHFIMGDDDANVTISQHEFSDKYESRFDAIIALSVFPHFTPAMAERYLKFLRELTKPSGHLFLTWYLNHPDNPCQFAGMEARLNGNDNFSEPGGNLAFALFSVEAVASLAAGAGLLVERVSYGRWRGGGWSAASLRGQHSQDIVILRPALPSEFDASAYLQLHEDVAAAGDDPARHYVACGHKEGLRLR